MAPGPNDIRYVCLSDMHLGAELSLLTGLKNDPATGKPQVDPQKASPVLQELVYCLRDLIPATTSDPKAHLDLAGRYLGAGPGQR